MSLPLHTALPALAACEWEWEWEWAWAGLSVPFIHGSFPAGGETGPPTGAPVPGKEDVPQHPPNTQWRREAASGLPLYIPIANQRAWHLGVSVRFLRDPSWELRE